LQGASGDFQKNCGNEFVVGRKTGGEFYSVFEFEMHSDQENRGFSAAIQASGMIWSAQSSIDQSLSAFNQYSLTQIKTYRVGGSGDLPEPNDLQDYARKFPQYVALSTSPVTLELITKTYDGVSPINLHANTELLVQKELVLQLLDQDRSDAIEALNSIRYFQTNSSLFRPVDLSTVSSAESALNLYLNAVNSQAASCFEDISACSIPAGALVFPTFQLPEKKECSTSAGFSCSVLGSDGKCLLYGDDEVTTCK